MSPLYVRLILLLCFNRCFNGQATNGIHETGVNARKSTHVVDSLLMDVRRHG